MIKLVQLYTCTIQLYIVLSDQVGTTGHLYCTPVYCYLWSGWYNCTPVLYNCLMFSIIWLIQLNTCTVKMSIVLCDQVGTTVHLYCTTVYCYLWWGWYNCTPVNCSLWWGWYNFTTVCCSLWSGWYNCTPVLYNCLLFSMVWLVQLYTCSLQLSIVFYYQVGTPVPMFYNCLMFSMIMLIQLYKCTAQLYNGLYDHIDTTVQLYCTSGYCSLWLGWYSCKTLLLSMIRLKQMCNCTVKPTNILYNQVGTTVQHYCATVYCFLWSGWYNYTTVLYSCLREALKKPLNLWLRSYLPLTPPTPLSLTALFFFLFSSG